MLWRNAFGLTQLRHFAEGGQTGACRTVIAGFANRLGRRLAGRLEQRLILLPGNDCVLGLTVPANDLNTHYNPLT
ncbi:hypothetical protein D3C73_1308600 [compost metagenome]